VLRVLDEQRPLRWWVHLHDCAPLLLEVRRSEPSWDCICNYEVAFWVKMMCASSLLIRVTNKVASLPGKVKRMVQHKETAVSICTRRKQRVYAGYRAKNHVIRLRLFGAYDDQFRVHLKYGTARYREKTQLEEVGVKFHCGRCCRGNDSPVRAALSNIHGCRPKFGSHQLRAVRIREEGIQVSKQNCL
jgi:hypothetical protein